MLGNVDPSNTSSWGDVYIGKDSYGSVRVDGGTDVESWDVILGYGSGVTGEATINGAGTTWENRVWSYEDSIWVGFLGTGILNINNGGTVNSHSTGLGCQSGSQGTVMVSGNGSALNNGGICVGQLGKGTLEITNRGTVVNDHGCIGFEIGSEGTAKVDGAGSTWTNNSLLAVGHSGTGTLNITGGGTVISGSGADEDRGDIGFDYDAKGTVTVDGAGSTWTNNCILYVGYHGTAALNITNGGKVDCDCDYECFIGVDSGSRGTVTVDGAGSTWTNNCILDVGRSGSGTLNITGGGTVSVSSDGGYSTSYIGHYSTSEGTATVDGAGSALSTDNLFVGSSGNGTLKITGGGVVNSSTCYIGAGSGSNSMGTVTVDGTDSACHTGYLYVGYFGAATLNIANGGMVAAAADASINDKSLLSIRVGNDDMLTVGGDFTNNGAVRLTADADLQAGIYTPISVAGDWADGGAYEAFGGVWDAPAHVFIVGAMTEANVNGQATIHLDADQRIKVGNALVASFMPTEEHTQLDFTATATSDSALEGLLALLGENESVQASWDFNVSGLPTGDDVMLSFTLSESLTTGDCRIWHYNGTWTSYSADDLLVSDDWASFTVDSFSTYAVTATVVPEPQALTLLIVAGLIGMLQRRFR
ncbi:MAG: hypothetical protein JW959_13960 [Pirellulales bacterium]|nr:hypothetical protein [Pirellulales bacterium]